MKDIECKEVIITNLFLRGKGVEGDPVRKVLQVWDKEGNLIAEKDDHLDSLANIQKNLKWLESVKNIGKDNPESDKPFSEFNSEKIKDEVRNEIYQKFDIDQEPDILAAFPDKIPNYRSHENVEYPSMEWFHTVYEKLRLDIQFKPTRSAHFRKMHEAIKWIKVYKLS